MRFRGIPAGGPHFTALNRALEHAFEIMDHVWLEIDNRQEDVTLATSLSIAKVSVPPPPEGYTVLVEGWCNLEWADATALDIDVNIEVGTAKISQSRILTETAALAVSHSTKATYQPDEEVSYQLVLRHNAARTAATVNNRGILARYVVNRGG